MILYLFWHKLVIKRAFPHEVDIPISFDLEDRFPVVCWIFYNYSIYDIFENNVRMQNEISYTMYWVVTKKPLTVGILLFHTKRFTIKIAIMNSWHRLQISVGLFFLSSFALCLRCFLCVSQFPCISIMNNFDCDLNRILCHCAFSGQSWPTLMSRINSRTVVMHLLSANTQPKMQRNLTK